MQEMLVTLSWAKARPRPPVAHRLLVTVGIQHLRLSVVADMCKDAKLLLKEMTPNQVCRCPMPGDSVREGMKGRPAG